MAALAAPIRARAQQPTQKPPATIPQATIPKANIPKATMPQDTTARATKPQAGGRPRGARRVQTLEIRAQVPVPQVVTVRPRLVPAFRAAALDSAFVDEHFWTALRTPYQAVPMMSPPSSPSSLLNVPPKER
jgi:hypothetical protein